MTAGQLDAATSGAPGDDAPARWVAAVRSEELVGRHIAVVQVSDADIALWRDADGRANAWENRCPHRGMRLSLGSNLGATLVCRYHGWRFDAGTGACSSIPAHPGQVPPRAAVVRTYATRERYGFVWIAPATATGGPELAGIADAPILSLRSVTFHAPVAAVREALVRDMRAVEYRAVEYDDAIRIAINIAGVPQTAIYLTTPQSATATLVHGLAPIALPDLERLAFLRTQNERLTLLRDAVEGAHGTAATGGTRSGIAVGAAAR